jgi:hypothetical protein
MVSLPFITMGVHKKEGEVTMADIDMNATKEKISTTNPKPNTDEHASLKGTLVAVFILGIFIVISWVSVFYLFVARN